MRGLGAALALALACATVGAAAVAPGVPAVAPAPRRIVSLLPSLTEIVCELQACERLVGTDRHSNWPARVASLPKLGGLEDAQVERIAALKPDLVLTAGSTRAVDRLRALGLTVRVIEPEHWAGTRQAIADVAAAIGAPAAGAGLVARLEERVAAAAGRVPPVLRGSSVYFEVAGTPHAAGAASFIGELLARLGLVNVVPASLGPFPQLNPEFVLRAQPALVMGAAAAVAAMPSRPGWGALKALQQGRSCGFDAQAWDALVRPGPRLAEGAEAIADCLVRLSGVVARPDAATASRR